jgi:RNA polymerase sigma-70 factor (ECF subfamily)
MDVPAPTPPDLEPDLELMGRVSRKEPTAERAVVRRLSGRVARLARLLSGASVDADDAAQVALLEILASAGTFRVAASLEAWADRITVRTVARLVRRESAHKSLLARWVVPGELPWGKRPEPLTEPLGLDALLVRLSPERREALVLRHALEYSVEEIAELTGAPLGTVKDRLVAARRELRKALERDARRAERRRQP